MENVPIISEFAQYGVIGICFALIIAIVIIVKIFTEAIKHLVDVLKSLYDQISSLKNAIYELSAIVKAMSWNARHNKEPPTQQ